MLEKIKTPHNIRDSRRNLLISGGWNPSCDHRQPKEMPMMGGLQIGGVLVDTVHGNGEIFTTIIILCLRVIDDTFQLGCGPRRYRHLKAIPCAVPYLKRCQLLRLHVISAFLGRENHKKKNIVHGGFGTTVGGPAFALAHLAFNLRGPHCMWISSFLRWYLFYTNFKN